MHFARLFALAGLTASLFGCAAIDFENRFAQDDMAWDSNYGMQTGDVQGRMAGDMPEVGAFEEEATTGYGYRDGYFMNLEVHATGDYGWAMVALYGEVDENGDVIIEPESIIGCTGPEQGWADFDEPAARAEVEIDTAIDENGDEIEIIEIEAEWEGGHTIVAVAELPTAG